MFSIFDLDLNLKLLKKGILNQIFTKQPQPSHSLGPLDERGTEWVTGSLSTCIIKTNMLWAETFNRANLVRDHRKPQKHRGERAECCHGDSKWCGWWWVTLEERDEGRWQLWVVEYLCPYAVLWACVLQSDYSRKTHQSELLTDKPFNSQWRASVFLLFSSKCKWRNLQACALSVIHARQHRFEQWLQTFLLRQLLDLWAVFRFPTSPGPVLAPQPRRTQLESHRHALTSPHLALIFQGSLWSR